MRLAGWGQVKPGAVWHRLDADTGRAVCATHEHTNTWEWPISRFEAEGVVRQDPPVEAAGDRECKGCFALRLRSGLGRSPDVRIQQRANENQADRLRRAPRLRAEE